MDFPAFFADAPTITLHDPLARFLGASATGMITYAGADCVFSVGNTPTAILDGETVRVV